MRDRIIISALFICLNFIAQAQDNYLSRCNLKLIDVIMEDIFNPPVASRIHAYANIAAHEVLAQKHKTLPELANKLTDLQSIPIAKTKVDYSLAAEVSFVMVAKKLVYSEYILQDFLEEEFAKYKKQNTDSNIFNQSVAYGQEVANHIITWAMKDNYTYTRTLQRYVLNDSLGAWKPTAPEYANGLEPNWYLMRSLVADNSNYIKAKSNIKYSQSKKSAYYQNAMKVYKNALSQDSNKINTALYWDDNPNTAVVKGHLKYFIHKATPGGHWLKITNQTILENNLSEQESAKTFALVAISIYEGFLNCWTTKYITNSVRPETYIQRLINAQWRPLIETPPFPEYTSGHSVVSAAAANTLSKFFGNNYAFTDTSQNYLGLPSRPFKSFNEAAAEASVSRFYGGIHYMLALDNGAIQGQQVSDYILRKLVMRNK
jgi:hypothetical protein